MAEAAVGGCDIIERLLVREAMRSVLMGVRHPDDITVEMLLSCDITAWTGTASRDTV